MVGFEETLDNSDLVVRLDRSDLVVGVEGRIEVEKSALVPKLAPRGVVVLVLPVIESSQFVVEVENPFDDETSTAEFSVDLDVARTEL